jgi:uncharacterized phage infection (PIP) family protein YhgE
MEGFVALSLACNIFQVIQFGFESVSVIHQTYEKGRLDENVQLQYATTQLEQATQSLQSCSSSSATTSHLPEEDKKLQDLASKYAAVATNLLKELSALESKGDGFRDKLKKALISIWKRRDLDKLHRNLHDYQQILGSPLII